MRLKNQPIKQHRHVLFLFCLSLIIIMGGCDSETKKQAQRKSKVYVVQLNVNLTELALIQNTHRDKSISIDFKWEGGQETQTHELSTQSINIVIPYATYSDNGQAQPAFELHVSIRVDGVVKSDFVITADQFELITESDARGRPLYQMEHDVVFISLERSE